MIATTYRQDTPRAPWWTRRSAPRHHDRPAEVLAVLQHARALVEAGWVKNGWMRTRPPQPSPARSSVAVQTTADGCSECAPASGPTETDGLVDRPSSSR